MGDGKVRSVGIAIAMQGSCISYVDVGSATISLNEDGSFVYTPRENKKGRDYFGYKAIDPEGNVSQEATVIIRIQK